MSSEAVQISTSKEEVAYNLMYKIIKSENVYDTKKEILDLYSECLKATSGLREISPSESSQS
tara:strand:- start:310 stop:495 length:186 start_codon:yes stop_codon:yes gene_type:complete